MTAAEEPIRREIGVLALVPDRWGGPPMPRHRILSRLARYYHVAWLEPPREWREIWLRGKSHDGELPPELDGRPGFHRVVPGRWLPKLYRPAVVATLLDRLRVKKGAWTLARAGCRRLVLYIWRPNYGYALDAVDHELSLYHVDDEYTFSEEETSIPPDERRLLSEADRVFLHSPALWERKAHHNPNSVYLPNGVDYAPFSRPTPEPRDLEPVPRPRVGYVGIVKKQLDLRLLAKIAERRADWSLVVVGPMGNLSGKEELFRSLEARPNVHVLGGKPPSELPGYVQHLDVCTLPYEVNDYTRYINPLKMYEYLAAGRPVVGAPLPAIEEFSGPVAIASSADGWIDALEASMRPEATSDDAVEERQSVARRHDWDVLARRVAGTIADALGIDLPAASP